MIYQWTKLLKQKKPYGYIIYSQTLKALEYIETNNKVFVCDALDDFYNVTHTGGQVAGSAFRRNTVTSCRMQHTSW